MGQNMVVGGRSETGEAHQMGTVLKGFFYVRFFPITAQKEMKK